MAVHMRYNSLHISLPSSAKKQREITNSALSEAKFRRRTSHEPNQMQMRKILCSTSLAFVSARVTYGV